VIGDAGEQEQAGGHDGEAAGDDEARAEELREPAGERADQEQQRDPGQQRRPGVHRRVAEDVLEVQRRVEEDAEGAEVEDQDGDAGAAEGTPAEEREVDGRRGGPALDADERAGRDDGDREQRDDRGRAPAVVVGLDERVGQREERRGGCQQAREVEPLCRPGLGRLGDDASAHEHAGGA
jgi:hypothetical protein